MRSKTWLIVVCTVGLLAGCGESAPAVRHTSAATPVRTAPTRSTPFSTANVPGLNTSPEDAYEQAKVACGIKPARQVAADFGLRTSSHERIAARYSGGYDATLVEAAATGCRRGLADYAFRHR